MSGSSAPTARRRLPVPSLPAATQAQARAHLHALLAAYLHHRPTIQKGLTGGFVLYCIGSTYLSLTGRGVKAGRESSASTKKRGKGGLCLTIGSLRALIPVGSKSTRGSVNDPLFFSRLKKLIRIVIPSLRSREAAMLALHSAFLLARTALSLYVADLDGRYVNVQ